MDPQNVKNYDNGDTGIFLDMEGRIHRSYEYLGLTAISSVKSLGLGLPIPPNGRNWWVVTGSNRRHSRCKRDALPTELTTLCFSV
jgi:hypothetical protein